MISLEILISRLLAGWVLYGDMFLWPLAIGIAVFAFAAACYFFPAAVKRLYAFARPRWLVFLPAGIAAQIGVAATLYSIGFVAAAISASVVFAIAIILLLK